MKINLLLSDLHNNISEIYSCNWSEFSNHKVWCFTNSDGLESGSFMSNPSGDIINIEVYSDKIDENLSYRWINPIYKEQYLKVESKNSQHIKDEDKTKFVDIDYSEIINKVYDKIKYETVNLELSEKEFLFIAQKAQEENVTFNQKINTILKSYLDQVENSDTKKIKKTI